MSSAESGQVIDPCGEFGPVQKWAVVWFFAVIAIGVMAVCRFSRLDSHMYDANAEFYDYTAYRENRMAQASLRSDTVDPRSHGDAVSVMRRGPK